MPKPKEDKPRFCAHLTKRLDPQAYRFKNTGEPYRLLQCYDCQAWLVRPGK